MTLNGVIAAMLRSFTEFGSFGANYVTVVEGKTHTVSKQEGHRI